MASCGSPSIPDGTECMAKFSSVPSTALDFTQKLMWHDAQVISDPKPAMGDSTVHSASVVVVCLVSIRVGTISVSTKSQQVSLTVHGDEIGELRGKTDLDEYVPSVMVDND